MFVCKVKGVCLTYEVSKLINFDSMKNLIMSTYQNENLEIVSESIRRAPCHEVVTKEDSKVYWIHALKRRFTQSFNTAPYRYIM